MDSYRDESFTRISEMKDTTLEILLKLKQDQINTLKEINDYNNKIIVKLKDTIEVHKDHIKSLNEIIEEYKELIQ
jgi:hypothetical protein